jgi:hypothetical protein
VLLIILLKKSHPKVKEMKRLNFFQKKLIVFYLKAFENKKVTIFALAITNCNAQLRNGRAVECGSLENC